jgi:hypothetical protein
MAALLPETTLLPIHPVPANPVRAARATRKAAAKAKPKAAKPRKATRVAKAPGTLLPLVRQLETGWEAALAAHQERIRRDFATLRKAAATAKPDPKLRRALGRTPKASGRLKDVRRAERTLKEALERLKA